MNSEEPAYTPDSGWSHFRDLMSILISSFGLPHQIAAMVLLTRKTRAHILQWLIAAEALARRLLLIQASSFPKPNASPPGRAKHLNTKASAGRAGFASDDSEKWSVSFKVLPARRIARGKRREKKPFTAGRPDARAIAERIEALIRVAADPEAYARRLSVRLHAKPREAQRLLKPLKRTIGRVNPAHTALLEAQPLAEAAARQFDTS